MSGSLTYETVRLGKPRKKVFEEKKRTHPLTSTEIPDFDLLSYLNRGGLPAVYPSDDYVEELRAYTALYLKEEIQNEALTRKVVQFSEFLDLIALSNGEEISYQSIAGDCGVSPNSIKNYIQILEDTLVAFQLKAFTKTRKRKAISRSKLYFPLEAFFEEALERRNHLINQDFNTF